MLCHTTNGAVAGNPTRTIDSRVNESEWRKEIRKTPSWIGVRVFRPLSQKREEEEEEIWKYKKQPIQQRWHNLVTMETNSTAIKRSIGPSLTKISSNNHPKPRRRQQKMKTFVSFQFDFRKKFPRPTPIFLNKKIWKDLKYMETCIAFVIRETTNICTSIYQGWKWEKNRLKISWYHFLVPSISLLYLW